MVKGLNLGGSDTNEIVYFGGADCSRYLYSYASTYCQWPTSSNPGMYWSFGNDPAATYLAGSAFPTLTAMAGTVPTNAGMAAARGADPSGNPLIIAFGGMKSAGSLDVTGKIYYLYNNSGVPTWGSSTPTTGLGPVGLANSAMVYSHVTGNFYLFGGLNSVGASDSGTWKLTVNTSTCGVTGNCTFSWTSMNKTAGMTCYPNSACPQARRSHRMVEVNYNNATFPNDPTCTSASSPCSFGIFMEGGSSDGLSLLGDRWMFDPTANGGQGNWQLINDFPPRALSAMTEVEFEIPAQDRTVHQMILFGGETGMQNPILALGQNSSGYFVPPTLGDTWTYNLDNDSWNRTSLFGKRYLSSEVLALTELEARAGSVVSDTRTTVLSPPPLSGAMMVTRTASKPNHLATDTATKLSIPEVFLIGGRKKDGTYNLFSNVYKFCPGSTGEKPYPTTIKGTATTAPDDATCDPYYVQNTSVLEGTNVGKWIYKNPRVSGGNFDPSFAGSFMGAAAYDSLHDLIVVVGGLTPLASPFNTAAVTDSSNRTGYNVVFEYTPPSKVAPGPGNDLFEGYWNQLGACEETPEIPVARYGHALAFDPLNKVIILTGGYDLDGNLLTQSMTDKNGISYSMPEVWTGYRIDAAIPAGISSQGIPSLTTGPFPCYYWSKVTNIGNAASPTSSAPPLSGISHAASVFIPSTGYNTGYYSTFDQSCTGAGTINTSDSATNRLLAGGIYFDIDRTKLLSNENLILNLTFIPLGIANNGPDQNALENEESAVFKIHLIKTGQTGDQIRQARQPRNLTYASPTSFPQIVKNLSIVAPPTGEIRQEQVLIPLSVDSSIDRIRVERYSGNAILIDASLFRTKRNY